MKVQQIQRTASVAWCHTQPLLASGTLVGTMSENFDPTGTLEIFDIDYKQGVTEPRVSVKTDEKLYKLAWSGDCSSLGDNLGLGLIAGGQENGVIGLWNPSLLLQGGSEPLFTTKAKHHGAVRGLDFNPFQASLLASGGAGGEVFIWDLSTEGPLSPSGDAGSKGPSGESEITSVAWNRQVKHILASSATNGVTVVWDLRAKRPALHFTDPSAYRKCTSAVWNPSSPIHLITTIDEDSNPVVHMWDLKNYLAPVETLRAHTSGVLSASFSPHDHDLLVSSGRDGKIVCWDLANPENEKKISESAGDSSWKFDVQWSPSRPCIASTCSLNGQIDIVSYNDFPSPAGKQPSRPRTWLKRPSTVSFAFGGQLVSVAVQKEGQPAKVEIRTVTIKDTDFAENAQKLRSVITEKNFVAFCDEKIAVLSENPEKESDVGVWEYLKMLFAADPRVELLNKLGFDPEKMTTEVSEFLQGLDERKKGKAEPEVKEVKEAKEVKPVEETPKEEKKDDLDGLFSDSNSDFDLGAIAKPEAPKKDETPKPPIADGLPKIDFRPEDPVERLVTKCLLVGNFEHAVNCCFGVGRISDALVLAFIGGPDLLKRTQQRYLGQQKSSFMTLVSLIVKKEYETLVKCVDLDDWKEVLAILCAWTEDEFPALCEMLGDRLYVEKGDTSSALLAYICAANLDKAIALWTKEEINTNLALHSFIERAVIFSSAINKRHPGTVLGNFYAQYAERLAGQGEIETALNFLEPLKNDKDSAGAILYNRIKPNNTTGGASSTSTPASALASHPASHPASHRPPAVAQPLAGPSTGPRPTFTPVSPQGGRTFPTPSLFPTPGQQPSPAVPTTAGPPATPLATPGPTTHSTPAPSLFPTPPRQAHTVPTGVYQPPSTVRPTFTPSTTFSTTPPPGPSTTTAVAPPPLGAKAPSPSLTVAPPPRGAAPSTATVSFIPPPSFVPSVLPTPSTASVVAPPPPMTNTVTPPPPRGGGSSVLPPPSYSTPSTPVIPSLPTPGASFSSPTPAVLPPTTVRPGASFSTPVAPPPTVSSTPVVVRTALPTPGVGYAPPMTIGLAATGGAPGPVSGASPVAPPPTKKEPEPLPPPPPAGSGVKRKVVKDEEPLVDGTETAQRLVHFASQVADFPEAAAEMQDITPRLSEFAEKAAASAFTQPCLQLVDDLLLAFSNRDFVEADRIYTQLSQNHYSAIGAATMLGFKKFKVLVSSF